MSLQVVFHSVHLAHPEYGMGQFGAAVSAMDVSAMKCEMCFPLECPQSAKARATVVWEACKRKSQSSTCP